jgi:hypothetical protein
MNERIKQLELQCWEPTQYGPAWFNSTKFAELLIRECVTKMALEIVDEQWVVDDAVENTYKYFGVTE